MFKEYNAAPRSPAQSDALDLLQDAREYVTAHHVHTIYYGPDGRKDEPCKRCELVAHIDAFLHGGSGG